MTRAQALALTPGTELHYSPCRRITGPRGGSTIVQERWRVNGRVQTWKTRPEEFRVPIKYGLRTCSAITHTNLGDFHLASECPLQS